MALLMHSNIVRDIWVSRTNTDLPVCPSIFSVRPLPFFKRVYFLLLNEIIVYLDANFCVSAHALENALFPEAICEHWTTIQHTSPKVINLFEVGFGVFFFFKSIQSRIWNCTELQDRSRHILLLLLWLQTMRQSTVFNLFIFLWTTQRQQTT